MANDLSAFNAELWSKLLVAKIDQINVMANKVDRRYEGELGPNGGIVKVRTLTNVVTGDYVSGQTIDYQSLVPTVETMTINTRKYFAFDVDDVDAIQNDMALLTLYGQRGSEAMARAVESEILSVYSSALTANQITNGGSAISLTATTASTSVYDNLVLAGQRLDEQNVPAEGTGRYAIVNPATKALLLKDTTHFVGANSSEAMDIAKEGSIGGGGASDPGFFGRCAGFDLYVSNAVPSDSGGKYLIYGDRMAINYVGRLAVVEPIRRPDTFATAVRGLIVHKAKVFAENSKRLGYIYAA